MNHNQIELNFSKELRFLIHYLRHYNSGGGVDQNDMLLKEGLDWDRFFQLLDRHRVTIQVYKSLSDLPRGSVNADILDRLKRRSSRVVQRNLAITADLVFLTKRLSDSGISYLGFKGPVTGVDLYGNPGIRQMRDLDILIDPDQLATAEALMLDEGYRRTKPDFSLTTRQLSYFKKKGHHFVYAHPDKTGVVEIHWRLFNNPALLPIDFNTLWQQKRAIKIGHQQIHTFSPAHTLLILCAHGSNHHWNRLFWLNDIARLLQKDVIPDWPSFMKDAKQMGLERMVAESLFLSHLLLDSPLPEPVNQLITDDPVIWKMIERVLFLVAFPEERIFPFNRAYLYKQWHKAFLIKDIRYHLWVTAGPPLDDMKNWEIPDPLFPLYYLIRPFTWFNRFFIRGK